MRSQGRSYVQWTSVDERARFVTFTQTALGQWIYSGPDGDQRTYPELAKATGISMDQISKWLRGTQVPSGPSMEKLFAAGVFEETPESMLGTKPWMSSEPDATALAAKSKPKPKKRKSSPAPQPITEKVSEPEFEVAELDIHDVISRMDIAVKTKLQLSALAALAESGAVFDIDVKVRAR